VKRSGKRKKFSFNKLKKSLSWAVKGFDDSVDPQAIVLQCRSNLYDNIPTTEISKALIFATRTLIEKNPAYSTVAARLLTNTIYKDAFGDGKIDYSKLDEHYRKAFIENIREGVEIGKLDPRMLAFNLEQLSEHLQPKRDDMLKYLGIQTLYDRYFLRNNETDKMLEAPQIFWMRVAMGLAIQEKNRMEYATKFYEAISSLRFVPSTPTLFHAGTKVPQLSSCYLTQVDDSLKHIFKCIADNAQMSKWSGGVANDWTNVRATGAYIKGTGVESQGVIPFLKIATVSLISSSSSLPSFICFARFTDPKLHTAVSLSEVFRVISVQRFELCTTPT